MRPRRDGDSDLRPVRILDALSRHGVRFVVVGSFGAIAQNAVDHEVQLTDIDLTPARDAPNLANLVAALSELGAREVGGNDDEFEELRGDPSRLLDTSFWTFATDFGGVDIVLAPAGFRRGFEDLIPNALMVTLRDELDPNLTVNAIVASGNDIYESKRQAGRQKDQAALRHFLVHRDPKDQLREQYRRQNDTDS